MTPQYERADTETDFLPDNIRLFRAFLWRCTAYFIKITNTSIDWFKKWIDNYDVSISSLFPCFLKIIFEPNQFCLSEDCYEHFDNLTSVNAEDTLSVSRGGLDELFILSFDWLNFINFKKNRPFRLSQSYWYLDASVKQWNQRHLWPYNMKEMERTYLIRECHLLNGFARVYNWRYKYSPKLPY